MKRLSSVFLAAMLAGCITPPPAPSAPYHARGTQPEWTLIIDSQDVTFIGADKAVIRQPAPMPVTTAAGSSHVTPRIRVNIVHALCRDGATERVYPDRVQVDVDGRRLHGCGGL